MLTVTINLRTWLRYSFLRFHFHIGYPDKRLLKLFFFRSRKESLTIDIRVLPNANNGVALALNYLCSEGSVFFKAEYVSLDKWCQVVVMLNDKSRSLNESKQLRIFKRVVAYTDYLQVAYSFIYTAIFFYKRSLLQKKKQPF